MSRTPIATRTYRKKVETIQAVPSQEETVEEPDFSPGLDQKTGPENSHFVTPNNILSLQSKLGNQAVQRMIQRQRSAGRPAMETIQRAGEAPVMARPGVGAYAMGKAPRVGSAVTTAPPAVSPGQAKTQTLYEKLMSPTAKAAIIEPLLGSAVQSVVIPELSKGILAKTRKELGEDIKADTGLYEKLGPDNGTREAALEKILQQAVTSLFSSGILMTGAATVKNALRDQAKELATPDPVANLEGLISRLYAQKNWAELYTQLVELDRQKTAFYTAEVPKLSQNYMEGSGAQVLESLKNYFDSNKAVKAQLKAQFNTNVDQQLADKATPLSNDQQQAYSTQQSGPKYRKYNINEDSGQDYAEYVGSGAGAIAAGGGVATKAAQLGESGFTGFSQFGSTAQAISGFGAAGGIAGVASGAFETVRGVEDMANSGSTTGDRVVGGGGRAVSGVASMVQQGATTAYNIAGLTGSSTSAAAMTATTIAGGGAIAMGAADMVRGTYGAYKGHQREKNLKNLSTEAANNQVKSAALQAATTQNMRKKVAGATVLKGALLVAGGVTLLVLATNPVGWLLLGAGALVGGLAALWRFWQKRKRKKEVAIRELGVEEQFKTYEAKKKEASAGWDPRKRAARAAALAAVKADNPLHKKMQAMGYGNNDYAKFYADYIHDTAQVLFMNGVVMGNSSEPQNVQMRQVVENMGFTVNPAQESPTADQIAKALHV